ncbi:3-dehydroquinate dehydratase [Herbaspirillum sp. BH-1]|uniref:type II 3-dehydroquinate dehydratase n=1 Tax=Herbaspirillum sp. (strain BH-1) TaxID=2058884 RepID=UPI000C88E991|nr:type II 3-dehydroquinate dehydratase [Herbaspirillum sp. BH-1]PLY57284.1 3-dehydroquinate dehydratase [Herbaspirillum sp. BH-1]
MFKLIYVLNGPNLNMLGKREPDIYGTTTLEEIRARTLAEAGALGLECEFRQTNHEGVMVEWLQEAFERNAGVIINPAGFSFASIPVLDAVKLIAMPVIELHISNIHQRDEAHRHSLISLAANAVICGLGAGGYPIAVRAIAAAMKSEV